MSRTTLAVVAMLTALVFLAGTGPASNTPQVWAGPSAGVTSGVAIAPDPQQAEALEIDIWLSPMDSTEPVRRLDPGTAEAQVVIQSNLRSNDPSQFRVEVVDASGIQVFRSPTLPLPTGAHTETLVISGDDMFNAYVAAVDSGKTLLTDAVTDAVASAQGSDPNPGEVQDQVQAVLAAVQTLEAGVERLRAFDLSADGNADSTFAAAQAALNDVRSRGDEVLDLLGTPPINWDAVRAKLDAMQTAATDAANQIQAGLDALTPQTRNFPPTGVVGRCNQNTLQLRIADAGTVSDSFWWTVGTPGAPARLTNPQESTSEGSLLPERTQLYSTQVGVAGVPHSTVVSALVLDALCVPVPGATVTFTTPADSVVTLQELQPTTDANGVAKVTVNATAEVGDGTATVSASVDSATASTNLTVIGPPDRVNLRLGGSEVTRTPNYGVESTVQVSAVVEDTNRNDVADGTPVQFSINPPDHAFTDSGQVTTADGEATATLVFGSTTGEYVITVDAGGVTDAQTIRVVGNPEQIEVEANPPILSVNTPVIDRRTSTLTVTVRDGEGNWAPDSTIVEFEFANLEDEDWAFFTLRPDNIGRYRTPISDGRASTGLVGSPTNLSDPNQRLSYRKVRVRVTATYAVGGDVRASISGEVTVTLRGETTFLPLIRRSEP